jgi:O-antigen ligase/tetratricopeptide (TPR) repeat protein
VPRGPHPLMTYTHPAGRAAESIARACTYFAVFALPLYFSVLTTTGYEPDKAALLRVLAAIAFAAWLVAALLGGVRLPRSPLIWVGVGLVGALALASLLSIDPRLSFWGSQVRQEGLVTWLAYLMFFVVVATLFGRSNDRRSLLTLLLVGSVPVSIYGYLQQLGIDPVPASGDPNTLSWPVRSTLGNHVFLGSYLVMVIPLTLSRLMSTFGERPAEIVAHGDSSVIAVWCGYFVVLLGSFFAFLVVGVAHTSLFALFPGLLGLYVAGFLMIQRLPLPAAGMQTCRAVYGLLLLVQVLTLAFTGARGAWLGGLALVPVFAILVAYRTRRTDLAVTLLSLSVLAGGFILLLNVPNGPLQPLRSVHGLTRLANITDSEGAAGSAQGRIFIWQGVGNLMTRDPAVGGTWGGPARDLIGYGPESLHWAFQAVFPLKLRQVTSEIWTWDRAHNIYLDLLVDAGVLGLVLFLVLMALLFRSITVRIRAAPPESAWLMIGIGTAVAGHLVDGFFGLETPVTLLMIWVFLGLVVADTEVTEERTALSATNTGVRAVVGTTAALAVAAVLLLALPAFGTPAITAALWVLSIVIGIRAALGSIARPATSRRRLRLDRRVLVGAVIAAATLFALYTETRREGAAFAERSGLSALASGRTTDSLGDLQLAVQSDPLEPQYRTELSGVYLTLGAGHLDSSDPAYVPRASDLATLNPGRAAQMSKDQLFRLGQFALLSARDLSPLDPDAYANLGNLDLEWNKPAAALAEFRRAETLSLRNPRYIDDEALAHLAQNRLTSARLTSGRALSLDGTFWYSHYTMALVDHSLGQHARSRREAAEALYWMRNYWPAPPNSQVQQLHALQQFG